MIQTSEAYKAAVKGPLRRWTSKVAIFFDGPDQAPEIFEDEILTIELLEEARADDISPLGRVTANEIYIAFDNSDRKFTATNTGSPYYGKLKPRVLIKPYLGLVLPHNEIEYIPLGVFRAGDWRAPSSSVEASITGYDRLHELGDKNVPLIPVMASTTVAGLFDALFRALGLHSDEYEIDPALEALAVKLGYIPKGKVQEALQYLAEAGMCFVACDRYNTIQVKSNIITGDPVAEWTDEDQIISTENPQKYLAVSSQVRINYKAGRLIEQEQLLSLSGLEAPPGGTIIRNAEFSLYPVAHVEQVQLLNTIFSRVTGVEYGAHNISIFIDNMGAAEEVDLEVIGNAVEFLGFDYMLENSSAVEEFGEKELVIDNRLIQGQQSAIRYAEALLGYVSDPLAEFEILSSGDPAVEIGDVIRLNNPSDKIGTVDVVPYRIALFYDGGLSARVEARKVREVVSLLYEITFIVQDFLSIPLEGATVAVAGQQGMTDADGRATFMLQPGLHGYTITVEEMEITGIIEVTGKKVITITVVHTYRLIGRSVTRSTAQGYLQMTGVIYLAGRSMTLSTARGDLTVIEPVRHKLVGRSVTLSSASGSLIVPMTYILTGRSVTISTATATLKIPVEGPPEVEAIWNE